MKKLFLSLAAFAMTAASVSAQADIFENENNAAYLGARIGIDVSSANEDNDIYSNGAGFTLGAIYNIPVYKNLYVEPGLSFFYDTFGTEVLAGEDGGMPFYKNGSIRNFGFRIPMLAGYFFDFTDDLRIAPFTGPQLNVSLIAREKYEGLDGYSIFGDGGFKHLDLQWAFGVSAQWQKYYVSISGGVGITRVRSLRIGDFADRFRRNTFNISVGYNF